MTEWSFTTASPEETLSAAEQLGAILEEGSVVLLIGGLGAGKTCFAQGVARGLEVPAEQPVTSPTFVIMNQYPGRLTLYHFDLYRLSGVEDLETIGAEEVLGHDGVCLVEWPQQCDLELGALTIDIEVVEGTRRVMNVRSNDTFHERLLERWKDAWQREQGRIG